MQGVHQGLRGASSLASGSETDGAPERVKAGEFAPKGDRRFPSHPLRSVDPHPGRGCAMSRRLPNVLAVLALVAGPAWADTANVDVTANIKGVCRIDSIQSVDFGDLEQGTTAADKTAPGAVNYWCTKGVPYTITLGVGQNPAGAVRQMKGTATTNATELLKYSLVAQSPVSGTGRGPQT